MPYKPKTDLYSLCNNLCKGMKRGPRQNLATRPGQNRVLKELDAREDGTILAPELCKILDIQSPSLHELLKKLEKDGFVKLEKVGPGVPRIKVKITPAGRVSVLEHHIASKDRDELFFGCLDEQERTDLTRILNKLLEDWYETDNETEGQRRERTWKNKATERDEMIEIQERLQKIQDELASSQGN